jgi:hypothetical protein
LEEQRLTYIVPQKLEAAVIEEMSDVLAAAREKVIQADNFVTLQHQPLTQMRPDETGTPGHQDFHCTSPLYRITPADLHRVAAAGKYHAEDARHGTYLSVISVTT